MLKEICTALLETDVNMKLVGCLSRMSGKKKLAHTPPHTHILELEHKTRNAAEAFVQVNYVSVVLAFPVCGMFFQFSRNLTNHVSSIAER